MENNIKKYIDANIFIYPILYDDEKAKFCEKILLDLLNGKINGFTSTLTWDEVVYIIKKDRGKDIAVKEGTKFLKFPNLFFINPTEKIITKAQKIFEKCNIKPRDAIHVASALANDIREIISDDSDFDSVKEIKRIKPENF